MTHSTCEQDSSDSIFCFVGPLGQQNSTPCFVRRNTFFTKSKRVPFGETSNRNRFDWMNNFPVTTSLLKSHKRVIRHCHTTIKHCIRRPYKVSDWMQHCSTTVLCREQFFCSVDMARAVWWLFDENKKTISVLFLFLSSARVSLSRYVY